MLQTDLLSRFDRSDDPDVVALEKIPLLEACVKEALRMSVPIRGRFPRTVPEGGLDVHGQHMPAGVSVSSGAWYYSTDEAVFPEPGAFRPQRWMDAEHEKLVEMQKNLVVFSHGTRQCIGQK
jgi:cytochrome P450